MKIFLLTIFAFGALVKGQVITRYFTLPLDHFSISDTRTFQVRYYVNEDLYREKGPVFIYLQLEDASTKYITEGNMYEIAEKEDGVLISLETRYYGDSRPTSDTSEDNLQWFTVYQMVADVGRFATFIKEQYSNAPVVLWASELGSALVTFTRQAYPGVIDGAWGSSAYINIDVEDSNYFRNVKDIISELGGDDCIEIIDGALSQIEDFIRNGDAAVIQEMLLPCRSVGTINDVNILDFMYTIELGIGTIISNGQINPMCQKMREFREVDDGFNLFIAFIQSYVDYVPFQYIGCSLANYFDYVKLQEDSWEAESVISGMRLLMWLKCTQFGMFPTKDNKYPSKFYQELCIKVFKRDFFLNETIKNEKSEFGRLERTTRLLLTQGELDAHRSLGPAFDLNTQSPVFIIPGQGISSDLNAPDVNGDDEALFNIKLKIHQTVREWIRLARTGESVIEPQIQNCSAVEINTVPAVVAEHQIQNCSCMEDIALYPVVVEHQIQSCSLLESITLYPLIFALIVIGLFLIWCAAKFFLRCKRGGKHLHSNICMESENSYKEYGDSSASLIRNSIDCATKWQTKY